MQDLGLFHCKVCLVVVVRVFILMRTGGLMESRLWGSTTRALDSRALGDAI